MEESNSERQSKEVQGRCNGIRKQGHFKDMTGTDGKHLEVPEDSGQNKMEMCFGIRVRELDI